LPTGRGRVALRSVDRPVVRWVTGAAAPLDGSAGAVAAMVLTVAVRVGDERPVHSRRAVLRTVLGGALTVGLAAACDSPAPVKPAGPDPLTPFLRDTQALLARYEAAIAGQPALADRLTPLRDDHRAHVLELNRELGFPSPAPTTPASAPSDVDPVAALRDAEKAATTAATDACLTAPSYRAALLGSIAACRATHVEALA
jgi:hypothetical protein